MAAPVGRWSLATRWVARRWLQPTRSRRKSRGRLGGSPWRPVPQARCAGRDRRTQARLGPRSHAGCAPAWAEQRHAAGRRRTPRPRAASSQVLQPVAFCARPARAARECSAECGRALPRETRRLGAVVLKGVFFVTSVFGGTSPNGICAGEAHHRAAHAAQAEHAQGGASEATAREVRLTPHTPDVSDRTVTHREGWGGRAATLQVYCRWRASPGLVVSSFPSASPARSFRPWAAHGASLDGPCDAAVNAQCRLRLVALALGVCPRSTHGSYCVRGWG